MRNLIIGMFLGSVIGGMVGTIASDEIYQVKKKAMKAGKKMLKKCNILWKKRDAPYFCNFAKIRGVPEFALLEKNVKKYSP